MTEFYKLSGAGNDFLALVAPPQPPAAAQVRAWCRRRISLGADGVFTLARTSTGARMVYWNADGSRGDLCLNGSRCAVQLACHLGWHREGALDLETDVGTLAAWRIDHRRVRLALPHTPERPQPTTLRIDSDAYEGFRVRVGDPHFVLPWSGDLAEVPLAELGPALRNHPDLGPEGANIHFVVFEGNDRLRIRSFERGVEDETLACGTGTVAAVATGIAEGRLSSPVVARPVAACELTVAGTADGELLTTPTLAGDARIIARGELFAGSEELQEK